MLSKFHFQNAIGNYSLLATAPNSPELKPDFQGVTDEVLTLP